MSVIVGAGQRNNPDVGRPITTFARALQGLSQCGNRETLETVRFCRVPQFLHPVPETMCYPTVTERTAGE